MSADYHMPPSSIARARILRRKGLSLAEIAAIFNKTPTTISRHCGDIKPGTSATEKKVDADKARQLFADGFKQVQIAILFGVSRQRIHQIVRGA